MHVPEGTLVNDSEALEHTAFGAVLTLFLHSEQVSFDAVVLLKNEP